MVDERTELQKRLDEKLLPLGRSSTVPFGESINPNALLPRAVNNLRTATPGSVGESIGEGIRAAPQALFDSAATFNRLTGLTALGDVGKGVVRGVFGTEDTARPLSPAQQEDARRREVVDARIRNSDTPIPGRGVNRNQNALPDASRLLSQSPRSGATTGNPNQPTLSSLQKDVQDGRAVEVIRGLNRSFKSFDQVGPGQDGEFTIGSLQPGALEGINRILRAGSEGVLQEDIRADSIRDAAKFRRGTTQPSIADQLVKYFQQVEGLTLPEAVTRAQAIGVTTPLSEIPLRDAIELLKNPAEATPEELDFARRVVEASQGISQSDLEFLSTLRR
jgi:hypothetical protein